MKPQITYGFNELLAHESFYKIIHFLGKVDLCHDVAKPLLKKVKRSFLRAAKKRWIKSGSIHKKSTNKISEVYTLLDVMRAIRIKELELKKGGSTYKEIIKKP